MIDVHDVVVVVVAPVIEVVGVGAVRGAECRGAVDRGAVEGVGIGWNGLSSDTFGCFAIWQV